MKYMLLIYQDETWLTDDKRQACYAESRQLIQQVQAKGQFIASAPLHPTTAATSVRVRDGKRFVTDGPFAETHEQLGGYYLINAPDLDEAISIASQIPSARAGTIEIRPVIELDKPCAE